MPLLAAATSLLSFLKNGSEERRLVDASTRKRVLLMRVGQLNISRYYSVYKCIFIKRNIMPIYKNSFLHNVYSNSVANGEGSRFQSVGHWVRLPVKSDISSDPLL